MTSKTTFLSKLPSGFEFKEEGHRYTVGDRQLASVTEIRDHFSLGPDYSGISEAVLAGAAEKGKALHYLFAWWLELGSGEARRLEDLDLPKRLVRDFAAIINASNEARLVAWQVEQPVVSTRTWVAGIPDFWGLAYDDPAILDLKTGETKGTGFQTAGYAELKVESLLSTEHLSGIPKEVLHPKRYCLAVHDGRAKLTELQGDEDAKDFRAAVRIYNLQKSTGAI